MARQFFFVHMMKTAGTSFRVHATRNLEADEIFPRQVGVSDFERILQYFDVSQFVELSPGERDRIRFFSAHVPYAVAALAAPEATTITVVRDPLERTISYLRHCQRHHPEHRGMGLEEIYDDEWFFVRFIENHQTKIMSMTAEESLLLPPDSIVHELNPQNRSLQELREDPAFGAAVARNLSSGTVRALLSFDRAPTELVQVDERRMSAALENLRRVDVLGTTEHLDDLMDVMAQRYGWTARQREPLNCAVDPADVPASFRRRIAHDNQADIMLYEQAGRLRARPDIAPPTARPAHADQSRRSVRRVADLVDVDRLGIGTGSS